MVYTGAKGSCVYQGNASVKWVISWYNTRSCCITILYHAIENTVGSRINATYAQTSFGMALNWLRIVYNHDNVFKTLKLFIN